MRRILFILACCILATNALAERIDRTFVLGTAFEDSYKSDFKAMLRSKEMEYEDTETEETGENVIAIWNVQFEGVQWDGAYFYFHRQFLYKVLFFQRTPNTSPDDQRVAYAVCRTTLNGKYFMCISGTGENHFACKDEKTELSLDLTEEKGEAALVLTYTNLLSKWATQGIDEK